jgi:hypothetical protein
MPVPGALPPQLAAAPANVGPVTVPQANPGNISMALKKVQAGVHAFEEALPMIPMGSPLHAKLLKVTAEVAKEISELGEKGGDAQGQIQQLLQMARSTAQSAPMQAMSRMFTPPNAPPAMAGGGAPPVGAGAAA